MDGGVGIGRRVQLNLTDWDGPTTLQLLLGKVTVEKIGPTFGPWHSESW